jgi:IS4 transposase
MRHHNSVLHGLLKHIPWSRFDALVDEHKADARIRRLSTKSQLVALLYGQLAGAASLREIEAAMGSHANRLYHLGAKTVSRSTLADANAHRPAEVFAGLFAHLVALSNRSVRRSAQEAVRLIDSTGIRLSGLAAEWAQFSQGVKGAKAHVIFDPHADIPIYFEVTPAKVNDITAAHKMPVERGATYVFDLGYYHFAWWNTLHEAGCRFVTRVKTHTQISAVDEQPLPAGSSLLYDRIGHLPQRVKSSRTPPFQDPVREIGVLSETGKPLRILTNDLDAPAQEIADLYKRRWAIELFFRWVKQTLKIRHFIGRSENAVRIQIAVALIAYLLLHLAKTSAKLTVSPLTFARLVRANLMHRRALDHLAIPPPSSNIHTAQLTFDWAEA